MRKIVILLICALVILVSAGVGVCYVAFESAAKPTANATQNAVASKTFAVAPFKSLDASGPVDIVLVEGVSNQIIANGDGELLNKMQVAAKDGELKISFPKDVCNKISKKSKIIEVKIEVQKIQSIELGLAAKLTTTRIQSDDKFELEVQTAAVAKIGTITAKGVEIDADTSASVTVGEIQSDTVSVDGETSASVKVCKSSATKINVSADTAASLSLNGVTAHRIEAEADTAAEIAIEGSANTAILKADTAGSINAKKLLCPSISKHSATAGSIKTN